MMRKFVNAVLLSALVGMFTSGCGNDDNNWEDYTDWRNANNAWIEDQAALTNPDGTPYYQRIVPEWDPAAYVLIHYFNDRSLTQGNLSPMYTSTVDVKYIGSLYDGTVFDNSYANTEPADSIYRTSLNNVIQGWTIALEDMRVGDTCEVVIPWQQGYGNQGSGAIRPYSALKFGIKLVNIDAYEIR